MLLFLFFSLFTFWSVFFSPSLPVHQRHAPRSYYFPPSPDRYGPPTFLSWASILYADNEAPNLCLITPRRCLSLVNCPGWQIHQAKKNAPIRARGGKSEQGSTLENVEEAKKDYNMKEGGGSIPLHRLHR